LFGDDDSLNEMERVVELRMTGYDAPLISVLNKGEESRSA
jgi:hypothetical protein